MRNFRKGCEQGAEVVGLLIPDRRVETARSRAGSERIPECDLRAIKNNQPFLIGKKGPRAEQLAHDAPERVAGMRVILLRLQRNFARHAAEDKDFAVTRNNRRKAVNKSHTT